MTITIEENMFDRMAGDSLQVAIMVDGRPTPIIRWTLNGITIENTMRRSVSDSGLDISSVAPEDAGQYEVTATNDVNSTSVSFQLIVRRE